FIKRFTSLPAKGCFFFTGLVSLFSILFFLITDKGGLCVSIEVFLYGAVAGVLYCVASLLTFIALGCGSFAMSMLILSYSGVFNIVYGLAFLRESVSVFTYVGLSLMMISLFLFRGKSKTDEDIKAKALSLKWLICIVISVTGCGLYGIVMRMQQIRFDNTRTNEFMIVTLGLSALILFIVGAVKDGRDTIDILKNGGLWAAGAGLSNGATNAISLLLNTMLPFTIVSPIRSGAKILLSFLLSLVLFKEKFLKRQIAGVIIGTAALVFLNIKI
ncbi:MAG: EamA family transporter, partial [Clostridia bacterium]|nr:EamA family transporter [Clostridia bacterium]